MSIIGGLDRRFEGMACVSGRLFGYYDRKTMSEYRRVTVGHISRICRLSRIDAFAAGCRDSDPEREKAAAGEGRITAVFRTKGNRGLCARRDSNPHVKDTGT